MIRTNRENNNVFIDEVDSMLVDKGETMLYLPHALPDLNALQGIYLEVWSLVNAQDFLGFPDERDQLHDFLKHKLFGGLCTNVFTAVSGVNEQQSFDIHHMCVKKGLIREDDHCLTTRDSAQIQHIIGTINVVPPQLRQEIMLIIQEHLESIPPIQACAIPKALHPFVKKSLKLWIQSAVNAKYFRPNKEYIIDIDRRESAADRYPRIIIMDNETGVEQESSEWGNGLHQFLQLKHNLRLSTESLKAVFMSNISFFTPRYTNIMGVTGTLGSTSEYSLLQKLYTDIKVVVLPTDKPSQLRIDPPQCCSTIESWEEAIYEDVQEKVHQGRAVLLICEDVERAKHLSQHLGNLHKKDKLKLYVSSHQEKLEEAGEIGTGQLIIATNLAGRGTNIKLSDNVKDNGGLHVCLSYLPPNVRVEQQAYGRAARSGHPGSCKVIFHDEGGDLCYTICKRDLHEVRRVADIEADYFHNIKFQEELFEDFTVQYKAMKDKHQDKPEGRPELDHCLDCWAYVLDQHIDAIELIPKKLSDAERTKEKQRIRQAFKKEIIKDQAIGLMKLPSAGLTHINIQSVGQMMVSAAGLVQQEYNYVKEIFETRATEQMELSSARLIQQGHAYMKQAVKWGGKYENVGYNVNYQKAVEAFKKASDQNPTDPFARYYEAVAQLNKVFQNKNTTWNEGKSHRRELKQTFYELIPLFHDKIKQCQTHITTLQLANQHQDQSLTANFNYFAEQKQHEIEVYHQYIESMQDIIGCNITPNTFDHTDWGEKEALIVFEIVKGMFPLKECRISQNYSSRLETLLQRESSYHTFESKIKKRIESLTKPVQKDKFKGVFPDKHHFWDQLKRYHLITHESVPIDVTKKDRVGFWNPTIDFEVIQFESWDCINAESFDWICGLSNDNKNKLIEYLERKKVLNSKG